MNKRIIVFDFDKTLTKKDTLMGFYLYVNGNKISMVPKICIYTLYRILLKLSLINNDEFKKMGVILFLKGKSIDLIRTKSIEYSKRIDLNQLYYRFNFNNIDDDIFIISASFGIYIKHLFPKHVNVLGSEFSVVNKKVADLESNCFLWNKLRAVNDIGIKRINVLYTDSLSDLPLATIAEEIFIVNKERIFKVDDISDFTFFFKNKSFF